MHAQLCSFRCCPAGAKSLQGPPVAVATAVSTIKVGKDGFEVSSPVLGVIILALSLGFFYLYPVYAYPIHEIF